MLNQDCVQTGTLPCTGCRRFCGGDFSRQ